MTIPSLFRKVGINVPRHVTVDGKIVLDRNSPSFAAASSTYVGTSVQPHRFHGGEDPAPDRNDTSSAWWVQDPEAKAADIEDMRTRFPGVLVLDNEDKLDYCLVLDTGKGRFQVFILPQPGRSLPSIFVSEPKRLGRPVGRHFIQPPHLYTNGALCVASNTDWDGHNYPTSVAVAWTAHWLACYAEWRFTGIWPTEGYGASVA